jgi:hypothetical protein
MGDRQLVQVWDDGSGKPRRVLWQGVRYSVSDSPTRLMIDDFAVTHPLTPPPGWRFQATAPDGDTRIFDIRWSPLDEQWMLEHCWA